MNNAKLFLMVAAPAALVVPIETVAAAEQVTITGSGIVGTELAIATSSLPTGTSPSYQWYYVSGNKEEAITGATNSTFLVPIEALGKTIKVKVTDTSSKTVYTSNAIIIAPEIKSGLLPTDEQRVNTNIKANISVLGDETVVAGKGYQWYYVDGVSKTAISGASNPELTLPIESAGKQITVEVKTTNGVVYTSAPMAIKALNLKLTNPQFTETYVLPGAVVKAPEVTVNDGNDAALQSSQITYSYQWYYKEGNVYSIIDGATSNSYTIPADALLKQMKTIVMKATAKVGAYQTTSEYSNDITVSEQPVADLKSEIASLVDATNKVKYIHTDFGSFSAKVANLEKKYKALPSAEKSKIENYDILQKAVADVLTIKPFMDKKNAISQAADKLAYAKGLLADYEKFDYLQRSLVDEIKTILDEIEKNPNQGEVLSKIIQLNSHIIHIFSGDQTSYNMAWGIETGTNTLSEFRSEIERVQAYIKTLPKDYHLLVQNQNLLKNAWADVKKVEVIEKKAQTIQSELLGEGNNLGFTKTESSLIKQANTLLASYNKLSYLQQSLMSDALYSELEKIVSIEKDKAQNLAEKIKSLQLTDNYTYSFNIDSDEGIQSKLKEISELVAAYKTFSKEAAKQITGIEALNQLQKDLKEAQKVIKLIGTYSGLSKDINTKYSKLASSYKSAKTAYDKLTIGQKSLIYNDSELTPPKESENDTSIKDPENKAEAKGVVEAINSIPTGDLNDFASYKNLVSKASTAYKELKSGARKYVTNIAQLQAAEKNVKGVEAFLKKVDAAKAEADKGTGYAKIQTMKTAYLKLPAEQQKLAESSYVEVLTLLDESVYTDLNSEIAELYDGSIYVKSISEIKEFETAYNKLTSAEKKQITNISILKQALSDIKKVEAFEKKYNTLPEQSKASVLKEYQKLTTAQLSLLDPTVRTVLNNLQTEELKENIAATELVQMIEALTVNGIYDGVTKEKIDDIKNQYEKLSATQKKVVRNYSQLASDLEKVEAVYALKDDVIVWQKAYNKLSNKLDSLYTALYN